MAAGRQPEGRPMKEREPYIRAICRQYKAEELKAAEAAFKLLEMLPVGRWDTWHYGLMIRVLEAMQEKGVSSEERQPTPPK